ncbi:MAG: hypothetical protein M1821_002180 [Bathelium mastoideum]|nr:MAG: hypothetical protein M1821_002180 [Bathelium mastoideum]
MTAQMTSKSLKVIIIGAGSTGLAIAHGLAKAHIPYAIYERSSPSSRPRDWGMLLHWGTPHLLSVLPDNLQSRLSETWVDPRYDWNEPVVRMDGATGEITARVPAKDLVRVSRRKLKEFLAQGIKVEYGKALKDVEIAEEGVKVTFEDGTQVEGSALVGTDGSRSRVRELLVGEQAAQCFETEFTGINYCHATYTAEQARALRSIHPILTIARYGGEKVAYVLAALDVPDPDRPQDWRFQNYLTWSGPPYKKDFSCPEDVRKFFRETVSRFCEPFCTAAQGISDDADLPVDAGYQWSPRPWNNRDGRMTLAGDAAHPMLPHRGQGLNNAMQDAAEFVEAMRKSAYGDLSLRSAVGAYEESMIPRGASEVELSLQTANMSVGEGTRMDFKWRFSFNQGIEMNKEGHTEKEQD